MNKIIDYFVDNSIIVMLLTILIFVMGVFSMFTLNKETFPAVDFDFVTIRTIYPGSAAEDVEKMVTIQVERELKSVSGIDEINGLSGEGLSIVSLKIDADYDLDEVVEDIRTALSDISSKVPSDVEAPLITKATNKRHKALMSVGLSGDQEKGLRIKAKKIRDHLERLKEISGVELSGYRDEVFDIQVKSEKLDEFDISLTQILSAIKDRQINITAGSLKLPTQEKLIRTLSENESVVSLENIVVRSNDVGTAIRVKDVATVMRTLKDPGISNRSNGKEAIFIQISSKITADVIKTSDLIKKELEMLSKKYELSYEIYQDLSFYVKRRLGILSQNGIQGIILVIICLVCFMNFRVSLITAMGAPFAFLVAFSLMDSMGITINLISMFGLILVLGMLVDDSIIVAEQFYQYLEKGMDPKKAAKKAAYDTVAPVTSTVVTTMIAFSGLFFMDGIMGKFLWPVPAVIIICLLASWIECFIILPGHLADFSGKPKSAEKTRWYLPLQKKYASILEKCLNYSKTTIFIFLTLFVCSLVSVVKMKKVLFPSDDVTLVNLNIKGPVGTPVAKTNKVLANIEKALAENVAADELKGFRTIVGYQWVKKSSPKIGSHYGSIFIELTMQDLRKRKTEEILKVISEEAKKHTDGFVFSLDKLKKGPPVGKPIHIEISHDKIAPMVLASKEIKNYLDKMNGVLSSEIDYEKGKKQIIVTINESEARRLEVSNLQIAMELRNAFEGLVATTIKSGDEDIDILVRLGERERGDERTLSKLKITNSKGNRIPLSKLATFSEVDGAYLIRRFNRRRTFAISGEIDRKNANSAKLNVEIRTFLEDLMDKYPGMIFEIRGETKDSSDSMRSFFKAFIVSLFIIFIILVVQFSSVAQPVIIMTAIPMALIGVVISFLILGLPMSFMAMMGVLGLVGVVINDSIVLVTFINRYLVDHGHSMESVIKASVSRFRPVILTTVTTVAGLLPVAHMTGGDPFLKPMAISFAYGLLFSTTITLIFVPCCYLLYMKFIDKRTAGKLAVS